MNEEFRDPAAWIDGLGNERCRNCDDIIYTYRGGWVCACDSALYEYMKPPLE